MDENRFGEIFATDHKFCNLFLSGCTELQTWAKSLRNLINVSALEITTKRQAVLPENEIANLSSLQYSSIALFSGIEFPVLTHLDVNGCERLKSLPLDRKHFLALEVLFVQNCDN